PELPRTRLEAADAGVGLHAEQPPRVHLPQSLGRRSARRPHLRDVARIQHAQRRHPRCARRAGGLTVSPSTEKEPTMTAPPVDRPAPAPAARPLLEVSDIRKKFPVRLGFRKTGYVSAVDGVTFRVEA